MALPSVTLAASGLFSKWGFSDGDVLDDFMWEWRSDFEGPPDYFFDGKPGSECPHGFAHALPINLVRRHLLPVLPEGFEIYHLSSAHNPVRATDEMQEQEVGDIFVVVTPDQILAMIAEMLKEPS